MKLEGLKPEKSERRTSETSDVQECATHLNIIVVYTYINYITTDVSRQVIKKY